MDRVKEKMGCGRVKRERMRGRERVKSILIPLIHTTAVLPTGVFTCTHTTCTQWFKVPARHIAVCCAAHQYAVWTFI